MRHAHLPVNELGCFLSSPPSLNGVGAASLGTQTHPTGFPFSPAEDRLKDGHHLKQLLLKALTLMLDAAESYAKVITESLIPEQP